MKIIAAYIYVIYYFLAVSFLLEYKLKKKNYVCHFPGK